MSTIAYYGQDWAGNIGNSFIDYSINYCLRKVLEDKEFQIIEASNMPAKFKYNFGKRKPFSWFSKHTSTFDLRTHIQSDYAVLGGSLLDVFWTKINIGLLQYFKEKQVKVIILGGGGGNNYSQEEIKYVTNAWKGINVIAFISRDYRAYENFKKFFPNSYAGIDNAFFLADFFKPAKLDIMKLGVKAFDLTFDRHIDFPDGFTVVSLQHRVENVDSFRYFRKHGINTWRIAAESDVLSDSPEDYLHIYGNSQITHSDRVHACVSTLSFGGLARYYDNSDRSFLFERVGLGNINKELVKLDQDFIREEKRKQLDFLRQLF